MTDFSTPIPLPPVAELIPHQAPMILIDKVLSAGEEHVHCQLEVTQAHTFFDHDSQTIPAWVGIELMAQTVATWSGYRARQAGSLPPIGFLLGSRRYHSDVSAFALGQILDIRAERLMEDNGMAVFSCRIESQGQQLAVSQLNAFVPSAEKLAAMQQHKEAKS
ncbi:hotdog family protein [Shewanella sp. GXUN23E]|uniref:hotdog family protein n=1 Tax=Shewanella sp. GXUN23E TaxID=3422498 RepID=UPI003D7C8AB4